MTRRERIYLDKRKGLLVFEGPEPTEEQKLQVEYAIRGFMESKRKICCVFLPHGTTLKYIKL